MSERIHDPFTIRNVETERWKRVLTIILALIAVVVVVGVVASAFHDAYVQPGASALTKPAAASSQPPRPGSGAEAP